MTMLSIVLPAYNEELRIVTALNLIVSHFTGYDPGGIEIVLVENGSTDKTFIVAGLTALSLLDKKETNHITYTACQSDKGKGAAVRCGIKKSRGKFILVTDVDLSTPIWEYNRVFNELVKKGADIAIGSRRLPGSFVLGLTLGRRLSSWVFNTMAQLVTPGIRDTQCGFKLMRSCVARQLADVLTLNGFCYDVELLRAAQDRDNKIIEVPVTWVNDKNSKVDMIVDSVIMAADLFKIGNNAAAGKYKK